MVHHLMARYIMVHHLLVRYILSMNNDGVIRFGWRVGDGRFNPRVELLPFARSSGVQVTAAEQMWTLPATWTPVCTLDLSRRAR